LIASNTAISNIDELPDNLENLDSCRCQIKKIKKLPKNLVTWKSYISGIEEIECDFPENLIEIDLFNNQLKTVPNLPKFAQTVDLSNNSLVKLPVIPLSIELIDLKQNSKLDVIDIQKIEKELPHQSKILYDNAPPDYFSEFGGSDVNYDDLFSRFNFKDFVFSSNQTTEYDDSNPHFIPLKKTYCI
jgi:hypothetical protein